MAAHQYEPDRDKPLTFHWRATDLTEILGLPRARSKAHEAVRASILAEAILGWETGRRVSYSRRRDFYSVGRRYRGTDFTYARVMAVIADLARAGWLIDYRVSPGSFGWQSSFAATNTLIDRYHAGVCGLVYTAGEIIILKDSDGELADYRDTRETMRLRKDLARINESLARINIEVPGAVWRGQHLRVGDSWLLPTPANIMKRIFSRGTFALHGRGYGWWQSIPKAARAAMTINGEATAEVDYSALHASILYGRANIRFSGDAYDVGNYDRSEIKLGFNIALNAKNERAGIAALAEHLDGDRRKASKIIAAIRRRHKPISRHFCSDAGVRLMRIDSELILKAMTEVTRDGNAALPVHDALIIPARCANQAAAKMVQSFEQIVGCVNPCQIKIKPQNVPHMGGSPSLPPSPASLAA